MTEFILSVASVANGVTTLNLIHSLLGDSYFSRVNHACGAINPLSRVEYNRAVICNSAEPNTSMTLVVAGYVNIVSKILSLTIGI